MGQITIYHGIKMIWVLINPISFIDQETKFCREQTLLHKLTNSIRNQSCYLSWYQSRWSKFESYLYFTSYLKVDNVSLPFASVISMPNDKHYVS